MRVSLMNILNLFWNFKLLDAIKLSVHILLKTNAHFYLAIDNNKPTMEKNSVALCVYHSHDVVLLCFRFANLFIFINPSSLSFVCVGCFPWCMLYHQHDRPCVIYMANKNLGKVFLSPKSFNNLSLMFCICEC